MVSFPFRFVGLIGMSGLVEDLGVRIAISISTSEQVMELEGETKLFKEELVSSSS